jgi:hypothetical protein
MTKRLEVPGSHSEKGKAFSSPVGSVTVSMHPPRAVMVAHEQEQGAQAAAEVQRDQANVQTVAAPSKKSSSCRC